MKPGLTEEQLERHEGASRRGAIEGILAGGTVAVAGSYWAQRNLPVYRRLPITLKALGAVIIVAPLLTIQAERRGLEYDRSQWEGEGLRLLEQKDLDAWKKWDSMTMRQKVGDWAFRHQYSIILGGWAGSLALAGAIIARNKYQTYPQKIVQARMWAQGLTIGLLIVAGALTHDKKAQHVKENGLDHSWKDVLDQQERDRQEAAAHHSQMKAAVA